MRGLPVVRCIHASSTRACLNAVRSSGTVNGAPHPGTNSGHAASGFHQPATSSNAQLVTVNFVDPHNGYSRTAVRAPIGSSIVDVAKAHGIDIHAACGQKLQCATCHVILRKSVYDQLNPPGVREGDLLDSTFTLTPTSRLGCQVRLTPELDGIECTLPDNNAKGNVRMSVEQKRPRIDTVATGPSGVPAVAPSPRRVRQMAPSNGTEFGLAHGGIGRSLEFTAMLSHLQEQKDLVARLESELRQYRSKEEKAKSSKGKSSKQGADESGEDADSDDLEKTKKELERTRVDIAKLGKNETFDDVIGLELAKEALREAVVWPAIADPSLFSGVRGTSKGLLLYGPPGCGKTMLARAAAAELGERASFFHVRPGDVMSKFYGESQRRVQALEELVRESAPAVVFFDEVDSLLGSRDGTGIAEHHRATTNALLAWMDGFGTGTEQVFFLGATNRAEAIDEAALRRFGEAVEVGTPNAEARLALLKHLSRTKAASEGHRAELTDQDLEDISEKTDGFSLADVDRLVRRAFLEVLRQLPAPGIVAGLSPEAVPPVVAAHFDSALSRSSGTSALREMLKKRQRAQL